MAPTNLHRRHTAGVLERRQARHRRLPRHRPAAVRHGQVQDRKVVLLQLSKIIIVPVPLLV